MNYIIKVSYGSYEKEYLAHRDGNTFYYDHNSPIGCSTIDVRNKRLIQYNKIQSGGGMFALEAKADGVDLVRRYT